MNVSGLLLCCSFAYFCADYFYILLKRPFTAAISLKGFFFSGVKYSFSSHKVNIFVKVAQFAAVSFGQEFLYSGKTPSFDVSNSHLACTCVTGRLNPSSPTDNTTERSFEKE